MSKNHAHQANRWPTLADRIDDKLLAIVVIIIVAYFTGGQLVEYLIGLILGAVLLYIYRHEPADPYWMKKWILGAHRAHGGDSRFPIWECVEPECEVGVAWFGGLPKD